MASLSNFVDLSAPSMAGMSTSSSPSLSPHLHVIDPSSGRREHCIQPHLLEVG